MYFCLFLLIFSKTLQSSLITQLERELSDMTHRGQLLSTQNGAEGGSDEYSIFIVDLEQKVVKSLISSQHPRRTTIDVLKKYKMSKKKKVILTHILTIPLFFIPHTQFCLLRHSLLLTVSHFQEVQLYDDLNYMIT